MTAQPTQQSLGSRYQLLFTAYVLSSAGTWIYRFTLPLLVLHLTGSALQTAVLYALEFGPFLLLSLPGGVVADRVDRRRLLVVSDTVAGLIAALLAVLVSTGTAELPAIYVVAFALACVEPIYHPAFQGMLPELVHEDNLDRANARMQSADNVLSLVGPVLAGGLVALVGYAPAIYLDATSFAVSALLIVAIRLVAPRSGTPAGSSEPAAKSADRAGFWRDLRDGLRYVARGNPVLLAGSLLFTGTNFGIWLIQANLIYYLTTYLHLSSTVVGVVFAAQGVGALLGSLIAPKVIRRLGNGRTIVLSTIAAGLVTSLLVVFRDPVGTCIVTGVVFVLGAMNVVSWFTLRQRIVPREYLGRVVAATRMLAFSSIPVAALLAGALEEALNDMYLIILIGAAVRALVGLAGSRTGLMSPAANPRAGSGPSGTGDAGSD